MERTKRLHELLAGVEVNGADAGADLQITGLAYDSRSVSQGHLFFAIPGFKVDGHDYINQAAERGAAAALTERWVEDASLPQVQVANVRREMSRIAAAYYDHPSSQLTIAGVTGTNGKTTTTYLLDAILSQAGWKTGLIGGIEYRVGDSRPATRTTPESPDLQGMLAAAVASGIKAVIMEVSSHGIDLYRTADVAFNITVFTNLSRDHLDLHKDMESYYRVKRRLFLEGSGPGFDNGRYAERPLAVVNIDDKYGLRLAGELEDNTWTFGLSSEAKVSAGHIVYSGWQTEFELLTPEGATAIKINLPGRFNLHNALAAAAAAQALGIDMESISAGLAAATGPPGRFELIEVDKDFKVVLDYAHNEAGLAEAVATARNITTGRLILVFGCPGERDREKRPTMGKIAGTSADLVILTTDDCYQEPPEQIMAAVERGLMQSSSDYTVISDRHQAIKRALAEAGSGDTVLIAGKGHESVQIMADGPRPFDDRRIVQEIIAAG